ncbi:PDF receptor [Eurytemora carolleeae]|uniref:PDF receptor n=1 Tax=Eurytemora carolleeae TaxID=1294199 RepID=UPI000C768AF9|nr:PDF receptor [Eurytemora carolleeae]|eukprot:XP_023325860.1 PDF receptor-like [Eurytemora affinis]
MYSNGTCEDNSAVAEGFCGWFHDSIVCWPPTPAGSKAYHACADIQDLQEPCHTGKAFRFCDDSGFWDELADYSACLPQQEKDRGAMPSIVAYLYFSLSLMSLVLLMVCMYIFIMFRSLQCPRLTVHKHLVASLLLFYISLLVYLEPYITKRKLGPDYREYPWFCKFILVLQVYSQMASTNWLFNEGFYLHSRITVQIFNSEAPVILFNIVGWVMPLGWVMVWAGMMESELAEVDCTLDCWAGWSNSPYIWLLTAPMMSAYFVNLLFLLNIVRILVSKLQANSTPEVDQVRLVFLQVF